MNEITNKVILEEIQNSKIELKHAIEASETRLLLEIATLNNKINNLESENIQLKDKISEWEKNNKKNNIVIFGLRKTNEELNVKQFCDRIKNLLDVDISESEINDYYYLGKSPEAPIKVELVSYLKKKTILDNCKKLKGTDIFIKNDLTLKQRQDNKILRSHLNQARQNKNNKCYIRGNTLYVNNEAFTPNALQEIEEKEGDIVTQKQINSAPATPTFSEQTSNITSQEEQNTPSQHSVTTAVYPSTQTTTTGKSLFNFPKQVNSGDCTTSDNKKQPKISKINTRSTKQINK